MLALATLGFAVNFWAWALISPLGPMFRDSGALGDLSESDVALLVAVPVLVGSLGRIVVGALTDRYGGRVMFPLISAATIVPVLFIAFVALDSYTLLLVGGFFLGIAGTAFAVGRPVRQRVVPARSDAAWRSASSAPAWAAPRSAPSPRSSSTPTWVRRRRSSSPRPSWPSTRSLAWLLLRDAPGRVVPTTSLASRLNANARLPITWQACILYAVAFGGYVAFSVYLPAYLKTAHGLTPADAANRMAGFVVVAVRDAAGRRLAVRPVRPDPGAGDGVRRGGRGRGHLGRHPAAGRASAPWRSWRWRPRSVPGSGATFALIARVTDPSRVGGVTGLVGAAGGLGGFVPPLIMGYVYGRTDSYAIGLWMLSITAALTLVLTLTVVRRTAQRQEAH